MKQSYSPRHGSDTAIQDVSPFFAAQRIKQEFVALPRIPLARKSMDGFSCTKKSAARQRVAGGIRALLTATVISTLLFAGCDESSVTSPSLGVPTSLTAAAGNEQVTLNWSAPAGDTMVSEYRIYRSNDGTPSARIATGTTITTTSYIDTGLTNNTVYIYTVRSANANEAESADSNPVSATPLASAVSDITAVAVSNTQIQLTWTNPTANTLTAIEISWATAATPDTPGHIQLPKCNTPLLWLTFT